ncbi:MAG: hypothetical protein IPL78_10045 [Chloroflexi bacterium]|nr:hypothetical protein [Chloroflexota bacterium]
MDVMFETVAPPDIGFWELNIQQKIEIKTSRDVARRRVSIFVGEQIAHLLYGEPPTLVLRGDRAFWRVPVALATTTLGRIGQVGAWSVSCWNVQRGSETMPNAWLPVPHFEQSRD